MNLFHDEEIILLKNDIRNYVNAFHIFVWNRNLGIKLSVKKKAYYGFLTTGIVITRYYWKTSLVTNL